MVYLSQVFFDSGYVVEKLDGIIAAAPDDAFVVIDGYHGFMALPTDLSGVSERIFYLGGGYKYAMAGEGACFMHCPPGFGERPIDTGWFAGFDDLTKRGADITYGHDGDRFWGATFEPSGLYRLLAVLRLMEIEGITPAVIHRHVEDLQQQLLATGTVPGELIPAAGRPRGNFLTFRTDRAEASTRASTTRTSSSITGVIGYGLVSGSIRIPTTWSASRKPSQPSSRSVMWRA